MRLFRRALARIAGLVRQDEDDAEQREEFEAHLAMEAAENVRRGMTPDEARRQALIASGGVTQAAEAVRDQRGLPWAESLWSDMRYSLRSLRRSPGFTVVVIATLALGIGANTAIFSVVRAVALKALPHRDGGQLVYLRHSMEGPGGDNLAFSVPEVRDIRQGVAAFGGGTAEFSEWSVTLQRYEVAERMPVGLVTGNYFSVMGLAPILGRTTQPADDGPGVPGVMVLTHEGWRRRFGGDSSVVGRTFLVDGKPVTVVGVLQPAPFFPGRADALLNMVVSDHHLSASMVEGRTHRMTEVIARLSSGATVEEARTQVQTVYARMLSAYPDAYTSGAQHRVSVIPFKQVMAERANVALLLLMGIASFIIVIAVANVANLTLMRGARRDQELVIRASLGAGVSRLRRLLLTENLVLSLLGGALAMAIAVGGVRLLTAVVARYTPRSTEITLDGTVLGFTLAMALVVALLLSLIAVMPREGRLAAALLAGSSRSSGGLSKHRLLRGLVVVQVAVSVVLLAGAGVLTRTMIQLSGVSTGLASEDVLTMEVSLVTPTQLLTDPSADARAKEQYERMRREIAALPGVMDVGVGSPTPLRRSTVLFDVKAEGMAPSTTNEVLPRAELRTADPSFFSAGGIPLVRGRAFELTDRRGSALVVVINQVLADELFPGQDAIGKRVAWTGEILKFTPISGAWRTVVGVTGNTQDGGLDARIRPVMYVPFAQELALGGGFVIRAEGDAVGLAPSVNRVVQRIAPTAPIENVLTVAQIKDQSVSPRRLNAALVSSFGLLAAVIAAVGIAGVLAFSVSLRTNEIGIRMSLGADRTRVVRLILGEGGVLVLLGLATGVTGAYFATRVIQGLLFGVSPFDPFTIASVVSLMTAIGVLACWFPARRAARIDPVITMRSQ